MKLPEGLVESDKLPEPIYTPSTKADLGDHDENISFEQSVDCLLYTSPLEIFLRTVLLLRLLHSVTYHKMQ